MKGAFTVQRGEQDVREGGRRRGFGMFNTAL
jgi:hypothetical protein